MEFETAVQGRPSQALGRTQKGVLFIEGVDSHGRPSLRRHSFKRKSELSSGSFVGKPRISVRASHPETVS